MKVKKTKLGNIKIVVSIKEAQTFEKILGNMSHTDIKTAVERHSPNDIVYPEDTELVATLWEYLDSMTYQYDA